MSIILLFFDSSDQRFISIHQVEYIKFHIVLSNNFISEIIHIVLKSNFYNKHNNNINDLNATIKDPQFDAVYIRVHVCG